MNERRNATGRPVEVLLIEDDPEYRQLVDRWLAVCSEPAFSLTWTPRLDDAWHLIECADAIVLDLGLPDAAGLDTLVAARELAATRPIVVLTGMDDESDLGRRALAAGADAFVPKRLAGRDTLLVALRRALTSSAVGAAPGEARARGADAAVEFEDFWIDARFGLRALRARH